MTDFTLIGYRLAEFVMKTGSNNRRLAEKIGIGYSMVSHVLTGKVQITARIIVGVAIMYPELNMDWLLHGRGEMLMPEIPDSSRDVPKLSTEKRLDVLEKRVKALERKAKGT